MKRMILLIGLAFAIAAPLSTLAQSTNSPTASSSPEVRDVAANPSAHLGHLTLSGVVGIVTPEKGFVLMDNKKYEEEGFGCGSSCKRDPI